MKKTILSFIREGLGVLAVAAIFLVPFYFVLINSFKDSKEASWMQITLPSKFHILDNYGEVLTYQDGAVLRGFMNSTVITVLSVVVLIIVCSMVGYVVDRRRGKYSGLINAVILSGLIVPPSIVPTYWVLNMLHLFKTIPGIVLVEVAVNFSFVTLLYSGFMRTISVEIDEAATIDGCGRHRLFFQIILPLLKPVTSTITILSFVNIFNDFSNPLYFLPGTKNVTVQLTLYYFMSMFDTEWNLLFADIVLICIPTLVLFIFFNKKIIAGMTSGALKA